MPNENISEYTGLILVSGQDRPGITEKLMKVLSPFSIKILDIEQLIIRDRVILTVLIVLNPDHALAIAKDLEEFEKDSDLDIAVDFTEHVDQISLSDSLIVVIIGEGVRASAIAAIASEIAKLGGNIQSIRRTANNPIKAIELQLSISNQSIKDVQRQLALVAGANKIDMAVEQGGKVRSLKRVVLLDMDSTFIQQEVIDLLAQHAGQADAVKKITSQAMNGEIDFHQALIERVSLLKGLSEDVIESTRRELTLTKGVEELISKLHFYGHKVGVVSGGFINVIEPMLKSLNIDFYRANALEIIDGKLTGKIIGEIIDKNAKLKALKEFAEENKVNLQQSIAIGDGANDIEMIQAAGLGISFNAKPKVIAAADTNLTSADLSSVLLLMGISS